MKDFFQTYRVNIDNADVNRNKKIFLRLVLNLIMKANDQFIRQNSQYCHYFPILYHQLIQQVLCEGWQIWCKIQQVNNGQLVSDSQTEYQDLKEQTGQINEEPNDLPRYNQNTQQLPKQYKQQLVTTFYEHNDVVSCLDTNRHFLVSGSYDGSVKLLQLNRVLNDYS